MTYLSNYPFVWLLILTSTFYLYLIEDGSALGMSIVLPWLNKETQSKALSLLLPVWDINQTWLVFTLAGLYGGFSLGFVLIMQRLYLPTWFLVILLICRGAAIEYAIKDKGGRWLFALSFFSLMVIILQGYIICDLTHFIFNSFGSIVMQRMLPCFLGIVTFVLFDLQLGVPFLSEKIDRRVEKIIFLTFLIFFMLFILSCQSLTNDAIKYIYKPIYIYAVAALFSAMCISFYVKEWIYGVALRLLALAHVGVLEFLAFPMVFPGNISYIQASSNDNALLVMIIASVITLPCIFIVIRVFKSYFRKNMHDIYY